MQVMKRNVELQDAALQSSTILWIMSRFLKTLGIRFLFFLDSFS